MILYKQKNIQKEIAANKKDNIKILKNKNNKNNNWLFIKGIKTACSQTKYCSNDIIKIKMMKKNILFL